MVAMVLPLDVLTTLPLRRADVVTVWTAGPWLSRMSCRQLLESVTCYDVMPRKTCVVVIDSELPVRAHSLTHTPSFLHGHYTGEPVRGRPRTAWMDNIKTWTGLSVEESVRMTQDRDKWRK